MGQARLTSLAVCHANMKRLEAIDNKIMCDNFINKTDERRKIIGLQKFSCLLFHYICMEIAQHFLS